MLIGQTIFAPGSDPGAVYYTPWFPRQSDAFTAVIEILKASGAYSMDVEIETKNREQADSSAITLGAAYSITSTTHFTSTQFRTGALELVRYKFTVLGADSTARWIHFRSNAPQWQPN